MNRAWSLLVLFVALMAGAGFGCSGACAGGMFVLRGTVLDTAGKGVEGAEVFVYDSPNTRRPADFIAPKSDRTGHYSLTLPPGKYWVVARVRSGEKYGPLLLGNRHSGEPVEIEAPTDQGVEQDFTVADIRDMAQKKLKSTDDYVKVSGRVLDGAGAPVAQAYVLVHRARVIEQLPDYVSAWTDESGRYTLYLPPGDYFIGLATSFPPGRTVTPGKVLTVAPGKIDIAIDVEKTLE